MSLHSAPSCAFVCIQSDFEVHLLIEKGEGKYITSNGKPVLIDGESWYAAVGSDRFGVR